MNQFIGSLISSKKRVLSYKGLRWHDERKTAIATWCQLSVDDEDKSHDCSERTPWRNSDAAYRLPCSVRCRSRVSQRMNFRRYFTLPNSLEEREIGPGSRLDKSVSISSNKALRSCNPFQILTTRRHRTQALQESSQKRKIEPSRTIHLIWRQRSERFYP